MVIEKSVLGLAWIVLTAADFISIIICGILCYNEIYFYSIFVLSFFLFEKVVNVVATIIYWSERGFLSIMLETFQLGFLQFSIVQSDEEQESLVLFQMQMKAFTRVVLFYFQMFEFFAFGLLEQVDLSEIGFSVYFLWSLTQGLIVLGSYSLPLSKGYQHAISVLTYQLTLSALLATRDSLGVNCGIYAVVIIFVSLVALILLVRRVSRFLQIREILTFLLFSVPIISRSYNYKKKPVIIMTFLTKLILFIIFIILNYDAFNQSQSTMQMLIKVTALLSNILYFLLSSKQVFFQVFRVKFFVFTKSSDILKVSKSLIKLNNNLNLKYFINVIFKKQLQNELNEQKEIQDDQHSESCVFQHCKHYYNLHRILDSVQQSQNIYIEQIPFYFCKYHYLEFLAKEDKFYEKLYLYHKQNLNEAFFIQVVIQKLSKGNFGCYGNEMAYLDMVSKENKQIIFQIYKHYFQIQAFDKHVSQFLINSPKVVLYDLYEV